MRLADALHSPLIRQLAALSALAAAPLAPPPASAREAEPSLRTAPAPTPVPQALEGAPALCAHALCAHGS
jgi:hypothetical protein